MKNSVLEVATNFADLNLNQSSSKNTDSQHTNREGRYFVSLNRYGKSSKWKLAHTQFIRFWDRNFSILHWIM